MHIYKLIFLLPVAGYLTCNPAKIYANIVKDRLQIHVLIKHKEFWRK